MNEGLGIRHRRWRHKARGYEVSVLDTRNTGCPMVTVDRTQFTSEQRTWTVERFLAEFEPLGRPVKPKTLWDFL